MYERFFGFKEKPFNTTPDSRFFFPSPKHTEALNSLLYAIEERKGFVVITGEIGAGKTTVCRTLLGKLGAETKIALITNTHLTCKELISSVLEEFEVEHTGGSKARLVSRLNEYLITQLREGSNVVLIIDEAQNLSPKVMEEVRMLSNLETETEKLIQIIMMGQPQLRKKLEMPQLLQFRQRVTVQYHLAALDLEETKGYIRHRINMVNTSGAAVFTDDAIEAVFRFSKGVPRVINLICDAALLSGFVSETRVISAAIIEEVAQESRFDMNQKSAKKDVFAEQKQAISAPAASTYCCQHCQEHDACQARWLSSVEGRKNLCCGQCVHYRGCSTGAPLEVK